MEGTCPECGLRFEWGDAFFPDRKRLAWLFEHKRPRSAGVVRAWQTWWVALLPPRFWRRVTVAHESRWVVVLWPLVLMGCCVFLSGAARMVYALVTGKVVMVWGFVGGSTVGTWVAAEGVERWSKLAAWAWGTPLYPEGKFWRTTDGFTRLLMLLLAGPAAIVASALITGGTIMTLTTSRRICGVKWSHVRRAVVYRSTPLVAAYAALVLSPEGMASRINWYTTPQELLTLTVFGACCAAWGAWWWATTLRTGWQMPEARLVAALLGVVDVLAGLVMLVSMSPFLSGRVLL